MISNDKHQDTKFQILFQHTNLASFWKDPVWRNCRFCAYWPNVAFTFCKVARRTINGNLFYTSFWEILVFIKFDAMYILIIVLHIIYTIYIKHITKILNKQKIHKFSQFKTSQMKRFQEISIDTEFLEIIFWQIWSRWSQISGCWINQLSDWSMISQMGWGRQPLSLGWKPIIWQDFCRNLHANERYWTGGVPSALLGSANATAVSLFRSVRSFNHLSPRSFESEPGLAIWVFFVISLYANVGTIIISSIGIRRNEIRTTKI